MNMYRTHYTVQANDNKQVIPKVIWEERVATSHGRKWTRPLHVLVAAQYPLQTNPITQQRVSYIHTAMPHASYTALDV